MTQVIVFGKGDNPKAAKTVQVADNDGESIVYLVINCLLRAGSRYIEAKPLLALVMNDEDKFKEVLENYETAGWKIQRLGGAGHFPGQTDSPISYYFS